MKAISIESFGGPDVLQLRELPNPMPGPDQVLVEVAAAGVNFMDTGTRTGFRMPAPYTAAGQLTEEPTSAWTKLPVTPGAEGSGTILALGSDVRDLQVGQRVAWAYGPGSYAEQVVIRASAAVPIPDGISFEVGAAAMLQGLTAHNFTSAVHPIQPGDVALVQSAAGGVGLMTAQMIKARGGVVIGRVSTEEKAEISRAAGADHVIVTAGADFVDEVLRLTNGEGVAVAYDGAGAVTFFASLASVRAYGTLVYYGQIIKRLPPIELLQLPRSVKVTYTSFIDHIATREELLAHTTEIFDWITDGTIDIRIGARYPLAEAAEAHRALESRATTGKVLLIP